MKTLLILRHAKSSWKTPVADHDRPLNHRGKTDAPRVGKVLRKAGLVPDWIVCSSALRARRTAEEVAKHSGYVGDIELAGDLYMAGPETYRNVLSKAPERFDRVLVVGHNPGLEMFLAGLTGIDELLPTAAFAHVRLDIGRWRDLDGTTRGSLVELWRPKSDRDK